MKPARVPAKRAQRGSMMVEVLVSVLLLSVSILGLVRVLANSMKDSGELEYRSVASTVADDTLGRLWVDAANLASHAVEDDPVPQLPNGKRTVVVDGNEVAVTVSWEAPGGAIGRHQVFGTISVNPP